MKIYQLFIKETLTLTTADAVVAKLMYADLRNHPDKVARIEIIEEGHKYYRATVKYLEDIGGRTLTCSDFDLNAEIHRYCT